MKLKLSDWASIAEIISGVAVVVTLLVLVIEVRDNTAVLRVSAYSDLVDAINDFNVLVAKDADSGRIWADFLDQNIEALDRIDRRRLQSWIYNLYRSYEKAYYAEQAGFLGPEEWERFERNICGFASNIRSADIDLSRALTRPFFDYITNTCE